MDILHAMFGSTVILLLAYGCGRLLQGDTYHFVLRPVFSGILLTVALAALLLLFPPARMFFSVLNETLQLLDAASRSGTSFVFGYLGGGDPPFEVVQPANGFVLAFRALPLVLLISALSGLLYHWRVLPVLIRAISGVLQKLMGIHGPLGMGAAANIFVGMIEGPLLVRPYLASMSRSELFALMVVGMATIAGTMMALYGAILSSTMPDAMGHILTASIISVPAALTIAMLMIPPAAEEQDELSQVELKQHYSSSMDAITSGTLQGIQLILNIGAMLIVLLALVFLANTLLAQLPTQGEPLTMQGMLGVLFAPLVWLIGVPWSEASQAGMLLGEKTILNEFIAYLHLASMTESELSPRSQLLMTYALCGFANLGSLGIMIGGLGTLAPERREEVIQLGGLSIVAGTLSTLLTAAVAGLWL